MRTSVVLPLLLVSSAAFSYEPDRAVNNFAYEAAECSAYFMFVSAAPALPQETAKGLREKSTALLKISVTFSSEKLTMARFELTVETMKREMDKDWSNLSIVNNKYGYPCIDFAKDPDARLQYWIEKKD